jgi:translation elongation factor EF-Tu-like GTPase
LRDLELRVDDLFFMPGRGLVLTGVVLRGEVRVGDRVSIVTPSSQVTARVEGLEVSRRFVTHASGGQEVALFFPHLTPEQVRDGVKPVEGDGWSVTNLSITMAPAYWWALWERSRGR